MACATTAPNTAASALACAATAPNTAASALACATTAPNTAASAWLLAAIAANTKRSNFVRCAPLFGCVIVALATDTGLPPALFTNSANCAALLPAPAKFKLSNASCPVITTAAIIKPLRLVI